MLNPTLLQDAFQHWEDQKQQTQKARDECKITEEECRKTKEKADSALLNLKKSLEEAGYGK